MWGELRPSSPQPCPVFQPQLPDACCSRANLGFQDPDFGDQGPHCFSVQVSRGGSHSFSVELGSELAEWEVHFQRATFMEVQRTGVSGSVSSEERYQVTCGIGACVTLSQKTRL